jgi:O-antigen/teichoic acid export membrane protein
VLGQYAVAVAAAEAILIVTQVPGVVTSPHVASMEAQDAARLTANCVRATLAVSLIICAAFYVVAPYLVGLLYGAKFLPLVPALRILLVAVMILSVGTTISNFFTLKLGKPEVALISAACAASLCIIVSLFLVPRFGMEGAAIATACAYFVGEGTRMTFFLRTTKMTLATVLIPTKRDLHSYARMGHALLNDVRRNIAAF